MDQLANENTLTLILNGIIILALLSTRLRGLRSLLRPFLRPRHGNVDFSHVNFENIEQELDSQFARLEQEIRSHLSRHATKNAHIIVLLVIDRQEVKELARVPIGQPSANK